jgi:hypothetical protein
VQVSQHFGLEYGINGVMPTIPLAPAGQVGLDPLALTDVRLSWHGTTRGENVSSLRYPSMASTSLTEPTLILREIYSLEI